MSDLILTLYIIYLLAQKGGQNLKEKGIIKEKQRTLQKLQSKSNRAFDVVTSTIRRLEAVNVKIESTIAEIDEAKEKLQSTENDLSKTKSHNMKVIEKFKTLIDIDDDAEMEND